MELRSWVIFCFHFERQTVDDLADDSKKIWCDYGLSMKGCVELNTMAYNVDPVGFASVRQHPVGLAKMAEMYLRRHLRKEQRIRTSNWEDVMTGEQLTCELLCASHTSK